MEYKSAKYEVAGISIELGAKDGWESIKVEGKYKYITITEVGEKLYVNKKGEGGRVEKVAEEQAGKIRAILESIKSEPENNVETKDRLIEELQVREVKEVIIGKEEKEEIEGARAGYIPYAYETGGESGIYHVLVVGEKGEVKYVISGAMSGKSKVYGEEKKESINELVGKESEESKEKLKEIYGIIGYSIVEEIGRKQGKMIYNPGDMSGASEYLVEYIDMMEKENRSIVEESIYGQGRKAQAIEEEEREKIVRAAERYLSWGVEYKIAESETKGEKKIYEKVREKWGIENEGEETRENNYWPEEEFPEGNAIAYVKGGIDTPRTFWKKLGVSYEQEKGKFFWLRDYTKVVTGENYTAGRNDDSAKGTGVDSEGFITGVISMSGLKGEIGSAATELDNYTKNINEITGEELKGTTGNSAESRASMRYGLREIEEYSVIIADRGRIRRGDILVKSDGEGDSIAVVVEVKGNEKEEIEVVYIKEERGGTAERVKWSELEGREKYTARRLVTYEKEKAASSKLLSVLDGKIDEENSKVNIEGKAEERQTNQTQAWRFIPNTGEYLVMRMGKIELKNESGIDIGRLYGEELEVKIKGKDRGYKEEKKPEEGNIYINKAKEFEVAYIQPKHKEVRTLKKKEKEEEIYEIEEGAELRIGEDGKLKYGNESVKIGIRPKEKEIYPGDDLIIGIEVKGKGKILGDVWSEEKDYIAVYDKKLLWRANLYIREGEGNDWNDIHPWNAPKSGEYDEKVWYGKNEWNKKYNLATDKEKTGETLINLEKGDGGQVVTFTGWTPLRKNPDVKRAENYYADRVAYDFPQEKNDKEKYINAWDSPFDFVYKMKLQREAIREKFFNESGPNMCNGRLIGKFYNEGTKNEIEGNKETISTLAFWQHTTAPNDRWRYYIREGEKGYVPGLGLFINAPAHSYNDVIYDAKKEGSVKIEMINRKSAGTDCIGFAERTASYDGNKYKWKDLPEGWIEGKDPDSTVRYENNKFVTEYPQTGKASNIILSKEKIGTLNSHFTENYVPDNIISSTNLSESEFKEFRNQFLKVIPGDVITYTAGESKHIGIITDVNYEGIKEAQSIVSIMDNIQVIESNYGSHINYVKKGMSTDGFEAFYDDNTYIVGSWFYGWIDKAPPKIRNFQIERLIVEEKQ